MVFPVRRAVDLVNERKVHAIAIVRALHLTLVELADDHDLLLQRVDQPVAVSKLDPEMVAPALDAGELECEDAIPAFRAHITQDSLRRVPAGESFA